MTGTGTVIAGIGTTKYYKRGASFPRTIYDLIGEAIIAAAADAGIAVADIDGFAYYSNANAGAGITIETALIMEMLGIPEVGFSAAVTFGGGGSAGAIGLASAAITSGLANYVVTVAALQQLQRFGRSFDRANETAEIAFLTTSGFVGPGPMVAPIARRHMHLYGTTREAFAEVAISSRHNALSSPRAIMRTPLSSDDYFNARMIAEPMCLYDFCLETEGAVAIITTSEERGRDLRMPPVHLMSSVQGGSRDWGRGFLWHNMPDDIYASSGHRSLADKLYGRAGVTAADVDVALFYDHFTPMVIMQLEDHGFCKIGEGGPFVESGAIRRDGIVPVNPHGGQLSEGYVMGATQIVEAVEQLRGTASNQVRDAEIALVTGGPAPLPMSSMLLRR